MLCCLRWIYLVILVSVRCRLFRLLEVSGFFLLKNLIRFSNLCSFCCITVLGFVQNFEFDTSALSWLYSPVLSFVCSHSFFGDVFVCPRLFIFVFG